MAEVLTVNSIGLSSPVGMDAASTCAAIRARISRFEEILFHDRDGNPVIASPAVEIVGGQQGYKRLIRLLASALLECVNARREQFGRPNVPLLVAIGETTRPDYPNAFPVLLRTELEALLGQRLACPLVIFQDGKIGAFHALARARHFLRDPAIGGCVVAAADSFLNSRALKWLEQKDRLKTETQSDGIIPGEAGAALWITRKTSDQSIMDIIGLGFGEESTILEPSTPNLGKGLAGALRSALADAALSCAEIDFRVGGMTGERLEFMEASTALARIQRIHKDSFELWVPAEMLGHIGAALGACMLVITAVAMSRKYAPGSTALLYASSDSVQRGACVVRDSRRNLDA